MKYNDLINEFLDLLDEDLFIIKIKELKKKLLKDKSLLDKIEEYKQLNTIELKKKLYDNKDYFEYLKLETSINIMIQDIKNKFKILYSRKCIK